MNWKFKITIRKRALITKGEMKRGPRWSTLKGLQCWERQLWSALQIEQKIKQQQQEERKQQVRVFTIHIQVRYPTPIPIPIPILDLISIQAAPEMHNAPRANQANQANMAKPRCRPLAARQPTHYLVFTPQPSVPLSPVGRVLMALERSPAKLMCNLTAGNQ